MAVSDSQVARELLSEGTLRCLVETSGTRTESLCQVFSQKALLHVPVWDWSLAHPRALHTQNALALIQKRLELSRAPWLSFHLGFSAANVKFDKGMRALSETLQRHILLTHMVETIKAIKVAFDVPILFENLDYIPSAAYEHICEPDFIMDVIEQTESHFLLDLAHAQVSASRLGYTLTEYLDSLPLAQVRQIHISRPQRKGSLYYDTHDSLQSEDYELLSSILELTDVWAVTLEYTREKVSLIKQIEKLGVLIQVNKQMVIRCSITLQATVHLLTLYKIQILPHHRYWLLT